MWLIMVRNHFWQQHNLVRAIFASQNHFYSKWVAKFQAGSFMRVFTVVSYSYFLSLILCQDLQVFPVDHRNFAVLLY